MLRYYPLDRRYIAYAKLLKSFITGETPTKFASQSVHATMKRARDLVLLCWYIPELSFTIDYEDYMAKNTGNFNLIEYRLNDNELSEFDAWAIKNAPTFAQIMAELAILNYKMSATFVENSVSWCVSITGKEDAKFNSKTTLTTWSEDIEDGLLMAYYKVIVVFNKGTWQTKKSLNRG